MYECFKDVQKSFLGGMGTGVVKHFLIMVLALLKIGVVNRNNVGGCSSEEGPNL